MWTWAQPSVAPTSSPFCELIRFSPDSSECVTPFLIFQNFKNLKWKRSKGKTQR
eukprot:bmy_13459T0